MNMIQHSHGILLDRRNHVVEHLKSTHLIFHNRVSLSVSGQANTLTENLHVIDMIHPLAVNTLEQDDTLQLTKLLRLCKLRFLCFIKLHSLFFDDMLHLILSLAFYLFCGNRRNRNDLAENRIEFIQIPLFCIHIVGEAHIHRAVHDIRDHLVDGITHVFAIQNLAALLVNDLTLFVIDSIVIKKIFTDTKVVKLNLFLCLLNSTGKHLMLDLLILSHAQRGKDLHQTL